FIVVERLVYLGPQVTVLVLVSRHLGREMFGQYSLVLTWATLFQTYANFGVTECLAKEIGREPERESLYFTHGVALGVGLGLLSTAVLFPVVWAMHYPVDITVLVLLAGGTLLPTSILGACRGVLLARRKAEYMTAVAAVENAILLPLNVWAILERASLLPIIGTMVLAKAVAACLALGLVHRRGGPRCAPPPPPSPARALWGRPPVGRPAAAPPR